MKKFVVFTSITDNYDVLRQPAAVSPEFDYICFVSKDDPRLGTTEGVWQFRAIDFECSNPRVLSRYPKINPHIVLPDYDCSLWIDGNISIADSGIYDLVLSSASSYIGIRHPLRDCAYDEVGACRKLRYINRFQVLQARRFISRMGLPRHAGMMENNVIFRRHKDPLVVRQSNLWWSLFQRLPLRDQFTHTKSLIETGLQPDLMMPVGKSARDWPWFSFFDHRC